MRSPTAEAGEPSLQEFIAIHEVALAVMGLPHLPHNDHLHHVLNAAPLEGASI